MVEAFENGKLSQTIKCPIKPINESFDFQGKNIAC